MDIFPVGQLSFPTFESQEPKYPQLTAGRKTIQNFSFVSLMFLKALKDAL